MPLPLTEDPFHDDLGYGAAIHVVSIKPRRRITWGILKGIVQGLWNFLVEEGRFVVRMHEVISYHMVQIFDSLHLLQAGSLSFEDLFGLRS